MSGAGDRPVVSVVMGSDSDWRVMGAASETLTGFGVPHEVRVVSAHRTPEDLVAYGHGLADRGIAVVVAGAGGAAHLPGMVASLTTVPVIGVPVDATTLGGLDALLSIVQMPGGIPVATVAVNGARNAGLLAVRILAVSDPALAGALRRHREDLADLARRADAGLRDGPPPPSPGQPPR